MHFILMTLISLVEKTFAEKWLRLYSHAQWLTQLDKSLKEEKSEWMKDNETSNYLII